jgi:hypothetical protein
MKGLFNKVKNRQTHQRFVVSTIRKGEELFETAVFAATWWYVPKSLKKPDMIVHTQTQEEAWDTHYEITARLTQEYPARLFQEFAPH